MSLGLLATPTVTICKVAKMVFNVAPGNFYLSQYLEYQEANGTSATVEALAGLAGGTDAAFVTTVLTNLGLADDAGASAFLTSAVAANGRGAALEAAISALDGITADDATYGATKTAFDEAIVSSVTYSTNAANNSTDAAELAAAVSAEGQATGQTFVLTSSATSGSLDVLTGTAFNDTFNGLANGFLETGDVINAGAGTDTVNGRVTANSQTLAPTLTGVENVSIQIDGASAKTFKYDATGVGSKLTIANATDGDDGDDADEINTISNITTDVTLEISGGTKYVDITPVYKSVTGSSDEVSIQLTAAKADTLTIADVETINIEGVSGKSTIDVLTSTSATKIVGSGAGTVTLTDIDDATKTVDASANTGGFKVAGVGNVDFTFTGGTGDDRVAFAASQFTAADTVDGGDGIDTIAIADADATATALVKEIKASSNVEVLELTTATAGADTSVALATGSITNIDTFKFSTAITQAADAADDRTVAIAITKTENSDVIQFAADVTGEAGTATSDEDGADAVTIAPNLDGGSNSITINLQGGVTITGGAAVDADNSDDETAGDAIDASNLETININSTNENDVTTANTLAGGSGAGGTDGVALRLNTNGQVNVTGTQNLDLGTLAGTNVSVDASGFTGKLTVTGEAGNNTIVGGSKVDTINGGAGQDSLTGGGAADIFTFTAGASFTGGTPSDTVFDQITDFNTGGSDEIDHSVNLTVETAAATAVAGTASINSEGFASFHSGDDTLAEKITAAEAGIVTGTESAGDFAIWEHDGSTYVLIHDGTSGLANTDGLIRLTGVTGLSDSTLTSGDLTIA